MAPSNKSSAASRRKSTKGIIVLKISPEALQRLRPNVRANGVNSDHSSVPPSKGHSTPSSSFTTENMPPSKSQTPDQPETPRPSSMLPPSEGTKKKGVKRASTTAFGSEALSASKARSKPGPKKKSRLDDIIADQTHDIPKSFNSTAIKLGPKANQGAINAGLRALDRSGKPCRKWAKESFKLRSFTGVCWEIPRWKAPPNVMVIGSDVDSCTASRFNDTKDNSQAESDQSEKSNTIIDIEMGSISSQLACTPVPQTMSSGETNYTSTHSSPVIITSA